jgi:acetyl esterase/lipase
MFLAVVFALAAASAAPAPKLESFSELLAKPRQKADARIAYGADPNQFGELWLPAGKGPFPVVVLIHGGCWQASLPGTILMDYMAADLRAKGVAVWNLEYRRIGHSGGGYPGTFLDVTAGVDKLRDLAKARNLDLSRVVVAGHSAGGHLTAWTAARGRLPTTSPLYVAKPLSIRAAVSIDGINDLEAYRAAGPGRCGEPATVDKLLEGAPKPSPYADSSPRELLPTKVPQVVVSGELDPIVPVKLARDYARAATRLGTPTELIVFPNAGHFEPIDPGTPAGRAVDDKLLALSRGKATAGQ